MPLWMAGVLLMICIGVSVYCMKRYVKGEKAWFLALIVAVSLLTLGLLAYTILTLILLAGVR